MTQRGQTSAARSQAPLWLWPAASAALAATAGWALGAVEPRGGFLAGLWPADTSAAGTLLQLVATAAVTITTLTFSITIVALQLASQQFSPRLLRDFVRDAVTKRVLSVLTATFVFAVSGLRGINSAEPVPTLVCLVAALLGVGCVGALLAFISHMVRMLRVDTMMTRVHDDARRAIETFYGPYSGHGQRSPDELDLEARAGRLVHAPRSGFVEVVDTGTLVDAARRHDAVVRVEVRPGDMITLGSPIATTWGGSEDLDDAVRAAVVLNNERTIDQDAAFGFRQLEDIAVKAMSPSINDPVTAATAIGHMGDLLVRLTGRHLGPTLHADETGAGRAVVPDRDLRYYLDLACGQVARFGGSEPTLVTALLRMLRDVAVACRDDGQRAEVQRAADLVAGELSPGWGPTDTATVELHRDQVTAALEGRLVDAFADRAGETRSM
ncbi:DUF2254 domain-containing protein [Blastococcus sp. MG754426]|uniref:DUF2254 domain-containing protein n=1 Tax=unclassified Blastococcus TaxID=2619396 RepID=UPI001EF0ABEC|nr:MULTISPECIES: DUF2254 domain-containing protein [unclassified Blastococcus]MCF6508081.1 DUF2254 domain-containing protein [Blastococcus sp. MG754426]MCF6511591.1 DUF2254 domain-containing protein [Blastococcus sp. MG754427]